MKSLKLLEGKYNYFKKEGEYSDILYSIFVLTRTVMLIISETIITI